MRRRPVPVAALAWLPSHDVTAADRPPMRRSRKMTVQQASRPDETRTGPHLPVGPVGRYELSSARVDDSVERMLPMLGDRRGVPAGRNVLVPDLDHRDVVALLDQMQVDQ